MKKYILLLLAITAITSCEIDDICTEASTPKLILTFYDATSTTTEKSTDSLYVWTGLDSVLENQAVDSIAIPLNPLDTETLYNFSSGTLLLNQLKITYNVEEDYVSRSCGYRYLFTDVTVSLISPSNSWISSVSPTTSIESITDQSEAHVQVFH